MLIIGALSLDHGAGELKKLAAALIILGVAFVGISKMRHGEYMGMAGVILMGGLLYLVVTQPSFLGDIGRLVKGLFE